MISTMPAAAGPWLETDDYERQMLLLFLIADLADNFQPRRTHLITFTELIKKRFPMIPFDETCHDFLLLVCFAAESGTQAVSYSVVANAGSRPSISAGVPLQFALR